MTLGELRRLLDKAYADYGGDIDVYFVPADGLDVFTHDALDIEHAAYVENATYEKRDMYGPRHYDALLLYDFGDVFHNEGKVVVISPPE